jgi:predicted molibdopterin-dependent oxidoreductase YjgC
MVVQTDTERVRHSRRLVLELLGSSVDLSLTAGVAEWNERYGADPNRFGAPAAPTSAGERDEAVTGEHHEPDPAVAANVLQPPKEDNPLYVRDYAKCILCYKCVDACGEQWQNTFAISAAGRGFDARIATEFDATLPESACVYCGNCIAVCPTGALLPTAEFELRRAGDWAPERQHTTTTVCPYCGVGCNLTLHVQDNEIFKVSSPSDHSVTHGNLCIKGRFGYTHVQPPQRRRPT